MHGFRTLLADLGTLARDTVVTAVMTGPTAVQRHAFELVGVTE